MDLQNGQLQEERQRTQEIQRREGQIAREQWKNGMRQYQPIMNEEQFRQMETRQVQVSKDSMQEYLNRTVLQADMLQEKQQEPQLKPVYRASVFEEPVPEPTLSNKKQEKRLKQLRRTNQYADNSTVLMQEEAAKVQQRLAEEHEKRVRLEQVLNGDGTAKKKHALLDNRLEELLHGAFCPEILAGDQLEQRYGQLLVRDKQLSEFVEVLNQNAEYMQSKGPAEQERIRYFIDLAQTFHSVLSAVSRLKGLDFGGQGRPQNDEEYQQAQMDYATSLRELVDKSKYTKIEEADTRMLEAKVEAEFQKYEQGYVNEQGIRETGYAEMRRNIKGDFDWLNVEHITDFYQVEEIIKLGSKIEKNPEAYAANRQLIDSIMLDLVQQAEAMGRCAAKTKISGAIQLDYANPKSKELDKATRKINAYYQENYDALQNRMKAMLDSVKIVLGIQKPDSKMALQYLEEKNFMIPEQEQLKENLQYEACYFADLMRNKKELYDQTARERGGIAASDAVLTGENARKAVLIRERKINPDGTQTEPDVNWNQQVIQLAEMEAAAAKKQQMVSNPQAVENMTEEERIMVKEYDEAAHIELSKRMIQGELNKILNFDMSRLNGASREDLLGMQRELQELMLAQMAVSDIGKKNLPKNPEEELEESLQGEKAKTKTIKSEILGERLKEYGERAAIIRLCADMARGYAMQEAAKQGVLTQDAVTIPERQKSKIIDLTDETQILNKMKIYADRQLITNKENQVEDTWNRILHDGKVLKGIKDSLFKHPEEEHKAQRYNQRFDKKADMSERDKKIKEWLNVSSYRFAGDENAMFNTPIFRSFDTTMNYQSLNAMSDEEVDFMLEQLAAGAFLTKESTQEEIAEAQEENRKGLKTYVEALKRQYNYSMKKYGLGLDTISGEDVVRHYQELSREFANIQDDYVTVMNLPEGILDMNREEDKLFYNQLLYYYTMGGMYNPVKIMVEAAIEHGEEDLDYDELVKAYYQAMGEKSDLEEARQYLATHGISSTVNWNQAYEQ